MKTTSFCSLAATLGLLCAAPLPAALNPAIVPADAQWVVHVDLAALRETALGEELIKRLPKINLTAEEDPVRPNFARILEVVGTATAFGTDLSGKPDALDGALVLQGTPELRKIAEGMLAQMSLTQPEQVSDLSDLGIEGYLVAKEIHVGLPPEPIVLVSKSREHLLKALQTYRGRSPSLDGAGGALKALLPSRGNLYITAATLVPKAQQLVTGDGPEARILQMAQAGSVAVGEEGERAVARIRLDATSPEVATKLVKIVEGITAMVSLAETDDDRLTEFVNSLRVQRSEQSVSIGFSYPTERILQMIEQAQQRAKESAAPSSAPVEGKVVEEWRAEQDLGVDAPAETGFTSRSLPAVALVPGTVVVLTGSRDGGEHARWDYVELTPAAGGKPQRFEAEYMRLQGYTIETVAAASGGEVIRLDREGTARFRFAGAAGSYVITARYLDENDGRARFALSTLPPDAAAP